MKTKDRILASAIQLFAEKGFTETTMRDIASACDIRASSIYNYFPSKQDILTYIINLYMENTRNQMPLTDVDEFMRAHSAEEVLHTMFFVFEDSSAQQMRDILRIFLQEQFRVPEVNEFMRKRYMDDVKDIIRYVIRTLRGQGKLSPNVDEDLYAHLFCSLNLTATLELGFALPEEPGTPQDSIWMRSVKLLIAQMLATE